MLDHALDIPFEIGFHTPLILLILVLLEAVLSADNAVALASIAQGLEDPKLQRSALNFGLVAAYVLRITLIITATWVVQFWQFEVAGAVYLLWLVFNYFSSSKEEDAQGKATKFSTLWQAIPIIAITDLAFSLDSVTTAIAVSNQIWLIITGGTIGVIALRFLAGLFIRWLDEYTHLEDAGYITVGFVGIRLLLKAAKPELVPPEWVMIVAIAAVFVWGFSQRTDQESPSQTEE
ncbi:MAG: DUF475 domain-containing protein [Oscillatoria sp. PMC 1068.18]|nr:DUF475 domain-containing protein [Oscillatoria sp. PMC 1076.18]MEC4987195.1 DUF475 domain-containing protein [Oscillatoria sp. PMC 1068.18]